MLDWFWTLIQVQPNASEAAKAVLDCLATMLLTTLHSPSTLHMLISVHFLKAFLNPSAVRRALTLLQRSDCQAQAFELEVTRQD